jgi:hypothetical protein
MANHGLIETPGSYRVSVEMVLFLQDDIPRVDIGKGKPNPNPTSLNQ